MATVSSEIIRRCKNTSRDLPESKLEETLREYMTDLDEGGYEKRWRGCVKSSNGRLHGDVAPPEGWKRKNLQTKADHINIDKMEKTFWEGKLVPTEREGKEE